MFEYEYFNGENFIIFDIIEVNEDKNQVAVAISNEGKIVEETFDLLKDKEDRQYFKYGLYIDKIYIDEFTYEEC